MGQKDFIVNEKNIQIKILERLWNENDYYNWLMVKFGFIGEESITSTDVQIIWDRIRMVNKFLWKK